MKVRLTQNADRYFVHIQYYRFTPWFKIDYYYRQEDAEKKYQQVIEKRGKMYIIKEQEI